MDLQQLTHSWTEGWLSHPWTQALLLSLVAVVAAFLSRLVFTRILVRLTAKTSTDLDDKLEAILRRPVFLSVLLMGLWAATGVLALAPPVHAAVASLVLSAIIVLWAVAASRAGAVLLEFMAANERFRLVQVRTRPIFELAIKVVVWGGAIYLVMLTWKIDATGWLASAGVVGVAVGFAAKDTVANLISGLFIMADAPYKLGDFVVLGSGERGMVTEIGIRTTRILTRDDFEVIVPNAVIAGAKIINEAGGPHEMRRVRCTVDVAYGSDLEQVREVLMQAAASCSCLVAEPNPRVRLRELGASGLRFQVMGWVERPVLRGRAEDALNSAVYNALLGAGIEIPYSKHDLYLREVPKDLLGPRT